MPRKKVHRRCDPVIDLRQYRLIQSGNFKLKKKTFDDRKGLDRRRKRIECGGNSGKSEETQVFDICSGKEFKKTLAMIANSKVYDHRLVFF